MTEIQPIPALDLAQGRVVRLMRGERDRETVYGEDPVAFAQAFARDGARWLHVVDLDGAFGDGENRDAVLSVVRSAELSVEVAGGVRSLEDFRRWRDLGAARVVFGTAAIEAPEVVEAAMREAPEAVAVALDVRDGRVRTRGWVRDGGAPGVLARRFVAAGAFIHTGVERDGTMAGPDLGGALDVARATGRPTIVAGGIGTLGHLALIREEARGTPIAGVILGRALYERRFTLREAMKALGTGGEAPR